MSSESNQPTVFTRIIRGELPGTFVHRDDDVVAFMSIAPIAPGHTLVVPVAQVDEWTDLDPATWQQVSAVSQRVGIAVNAAFAPVRVGLMIAGLEVPHCHVHVVPIASEADLDFARADSAATSEDLEAAAERIRAHL